MPLAPDPPPLFRSLSLGFVQRRCQSPKRMWFRLLCWSVFAFGLPQWLHRVYVSAHMWAELGHSHVSLMETCKLFPIEVQRLHVVSGNPIQQVDSGRVSQKIDPNGTKMGLSRTLSGNLEVPNAQKSAKATYGLISKKHNETE